MPTTTLVRDLMRVGVPTCREDTPLKDAARLLVERNVAALIVLDEDANMVGWIGEQHLARAINRDHAHLTAGDVMHEHVPETLPDIPAAAAAHLMLDRGLQQLFVTHHAGGIKYPAAVITLQDIIRIIAGMERAPGVGVGAERPTAVDLFKHRYVLT
ncbi:MAG TPA: CBS domain-containing protein [Anaerolineae bacterium]|nr:CBS domain-containing protein [Anaerolineae bacterium]